MKAYLLRPHPRAAASAAVCLCCCNWLQRHTFTPPFTHPRINCQWIDVTGLADGLYWLTVATNWDPVMREETPHENDYTNNEANVPLRVLGDNVTVLSAEEAASLC